MAVWAKIVAVFREKNWGGFWRVLAPKVAGSDFEVLKTLVKPRRNEEERNKILEIGSQKKIVISWK